MFRLFFISLQTRTGVYKHRIPVWNISWHMLNYIWEKILAICQFSWYRGHFIFHERTLALIGLGFWCSTNRLRGREGVRGWVSSKVVDMEEN